MAHVVLRWPTTSPCTFPISPSVACTCSPRRTSTSPKGSDRVGDQAAHLAAGPIAPAGPGPDREGVVSAIATFLGPMDFSPMSSGRRCGPVEDLVLAGEGGIEAGAMHPCRARPGGLLCAGASDGVAGGVIVPARERGAAHCPRRCGSVSAMPWGTTLPCSMSSDSLALAVRAPSSGTPEPAAREMTSPPRPRSTNAQPTAIRAPATGPPRTPSSSSSHR